ncbi:hypothetical protein tinsulaeT_37550 [Thalassotalea insulae]|uniref:DUF2989 domain-containing protein n=1 Tax=Thalassotalea insulae TaxID=2056778 RepID=A0ABQ6GWU9_9GAMM|nr:DUF2989 domain-containing protein [Thalassotalea insulae]GLX80415.1 hypothetical protein tinsulaeT_37550 [Thalassotalea insulae]
MKISYFLLLTALTSLLGCDSAPNYVQLCQQHPQICEEFHEDSWCKKERIEVGMANIAAKTAPQDIHKFHQLIAYENYNKCVTHASNIEHVKLKEKKTRRIENMMKARNRLEEIAEQTRSSEHPRLLYYHWTRFLDKQALAKFLAMEGTQALETPESQYELATYYTKTDQQKTLQLLFHALELFNPESKVNNEIFKTLSSIFAEKQQVKQAYIWLRILQLYDPADKDIKPGTFKNYLDVYQLDGEFLDLVAESTLAKITNKTFVPPKF